MKPLYILKLGGSVITYKNRPGGPIRRALLNRIAYSIKKARKRNNFDLILIHGAGSMGHQLAHKYGLKNGTQNNKNKWFGSFFTQIANQKLNKAIVKVLVSSGLRVTTAHTASIIIQKDKKISKFYLDIIRESLKQNCIPLLYGEMVFDKTLGMTICSGDSIAPYLARKLNARKIFFASDIDGIFTKDPHFHKDAILIKKIYLNDIKKNAKLSKSHNIDVTEGLMGKIKKLDNIAKSSVKSVEIFNGLDEKNFEKVFLNKPFRHTTIEI